ncbi:SAV_915 family protein [Nocardioides sp. WS12]|uniref:SAV_915 family protein n=1 Tax=Nocardioides sp. WS12 TaxID=2486272 RepID=UPI0015FD6E1E|nr:SAV_915 family protein [Nocardioides sp. WS12]
MNDQQSSGQMPAPPVVYLPVETDADGKVTDFKMLQLGDGRIALLGYTALDRFIDAWGDYQSWLLFETSKVDEIKEAKHFDVKLLDVEVPAEFRPGPPAEAQA